MMAALQRIYEGDDTVDDTLLNQISKYVFYDNLWSLAQDLGIPQTEISGLVEIKTSQEKIFCVKRMTKIFFHRKLYLFFCLLKDGVNAPNWLL